MPEMLTLKELGCFVIERRCVIGSAQNHELIDVEFVGRFRGTEFGLSH
jgi:hypothetical protein